MQRIYLSLVGEHFRENRQMVFLTGPRQAGKTTVGLMAAEFTDRFTCLNWDNLDHRAVIIKGPAHVAQTIGLDRLSSEKPVIVFDEIHKWGKWKSFLKGFFDTYQSKVHILVTGSSRLDLYQKGGDSLMGRYFPYRLHPLSVAELKRTKLSDGIIQAPISVSQKDFQKLFRSGGFPEPFLKDNPSFLTRWRRLRERQLLQEDIRSLSRIQELGQMEILTNLLKHQPGQLTNYSALAVKIQVSVDTIRRWIKTLESFFYCFTLKPWSKNIPRALLKEPKTYLWDWVEIQDEGRRFENMVALHLLKAVHFWTDRGLGEYDLWFIRDKEKREVDFLVTRDQKPWFLAEAKLSAKHGLNKNLFYFQRKVGAKHAFQVIRDLDFISKDCFTYHEPIMVPALTFLSQLV